MKYYSAQLLKAREHTLESFYGKRAGKHISEILRIHRGVRPMGELPKIRKHAAALEKKGITLYVNDQNPDYVVTSEYTPRILDLFEQDWGVYGF